jgi:hypothetical protein
MGCRKGSYERTIGNNSISVWLFDLKAQNDTIIKTGDTLERKQLAIYTPPTVEKHPTSIYHINKPVDIPLTVVGTGWSLYAFTKIYNKDTSTAAQIMALNKEDLASFNQWGTKYYSPEAFTTSNYFFYGSMPLPLLLLADKHIRAEGR